MATFKNARLQNVSNVATVAYTSSSDSTIILSILVANTNGTSPSDITISQNTGASLESYIAFTIPVPADTNVEILSNKYILPSGKNIRLTSSSSGFLDATISVVEV